MHRMPTRPWPLRPPRLAVTATCIVLIREEVHELENTTGFALTLPPYKAPRQREREKRLSRGRGYTSGPRDPLSDSIMKAAEDDSLEELRTTVRWLLEFLDHAPPRLVREVRDAAKRERISPALLRRASQAAPIIRTPREFRGPWTWRLPEPDELVRVRYTCPVANCGKVSEGWMEYGISRWLFKAGLVRYLTQGTAVRKQPPDGRSIFLRLERQ